MPSVSGTGELEEVIRPLLEVSYGGWGQWEAIDDAEITSAQVACGAHDIGRFTFSLKWGDEHLQPWDSRQRSTLPERLINQWARLTIYDGEDKQIVACGKVAADDRQFFGRTAGIQTFTAYGPGQILRRIGIYQSRWADETATDRLDWIPPVNIRNGKSEVSGNRSSQQVQNGYAYGGKREWTHRQYLEYLLAEFVDESDDNGPKWTLTGQASILDQFTDPVRIQTATTAADMLRRLVPERYGLDYTIRIVEEGFEIEVFSLAATATNYGEANIPANPNRINFDPDESPQLTIRLAQTEDHGYGRLTVVSARAIVCTTLQFGEGNDPGSLEERWTEDDWADYCEGTGNPDDPPSMHDAIRTRGRWRSVYSEFGAPDDWQDKPEPHFNDQGRLQQSAAEAFQLTARSTLAWTPLQAGWDYTKNPPQKMAGADTDATEAEFLPPQVWLGQPSVEEPDDPTAIYVPLANCAPSISVSAPQHDWGVTLHATPRHIIAACEAEDGGFDPEEHPTEHEPVYDYHNLVATIAFESDHRVRLTQAIPGASPSDGELVIPVEDAQCWILAPETMVGVNDRMQPAWSPSKFVEIRNDVQKLQAVMAGAIARYRAGRIRGQVQRKGLRLWARLVGCLLVTEQWTSPITAVGWTFGDRPETTCSIGYCG